VRRIGNFGGGSKIWRLLFVNQRFAPFFKTIRKIARKSSANVAKSLGQTARRTGKKSVVGFIVFGLLDDLQLALEAIRCKRSFEEQFRKNVEGLGNQEFIPVGGVVIIPNPFFVPGRL